MVTTADLRGQTRTHENGYQNRLRRKALCSGLKNTFLTGIFILYCMGPRLSASVCGYVLPHIALGTRFVRIPEWFRGCQWPDCGVENPHLNPGKAMQDQSEINLKEWRDKLEEMRGYL
jgi:hypothetical protein